jgi:hypothetical protein
MMPCDYIRKQQAESSRFFLSQTRSKCGMVDPVLTALKALDKRARGLSSVMQQTSKPPPFSGPKYRSESFRQSCYAPKMIFKRLPISFIHVYC